MSCSYFLIKHWGDKTALEKYTFLFPLASLEYHLIEREKDREREREREREKMRERETERERKRA